MALDDRELPAQGPKGERITYRMARVFATDVLRRAEATEDERVLAKLVLALIQDAEALERRIERVRSSPYLGNDDETKDEILGILREDDR